MPEDESSAELDVEITTTEFNSARRKIGEFYRELPKYKCHKEVRAFQIKSIVVLDNGGALISGEEARYAVEVSASYLKRSQPGHGGYYVRYDDGYESYSPEKPFEEGYTRIEENPVPDTFVPSGFPPGCVVTQVYPKTKAING